MNCNNCGNEASRVRGLMIEGNYVESCPSCSGLSEVPHKIDYASPKSKQKRDWQRETHAKDIMQPFEVRKGQVTKGFQPNKDYIKAYKGTPDKLSMYSETELKDSGLVNKKQAKEATTKKKPKDFN